MTKRTKNILLLLGFFLALLICYQLAFSKTIDQKDAYKILKHQETLFKNAPNQLSILKQKQKYFDSVLSINKLDGSSVQNNLLKSINIFGNSNDLKVLSFLEPHVTLKNDLIIKTYDFTIEGSYNTILKLIYQLEQHTKFGEIISLHFEKKTNYKSGRDYLQARILLKSFS